MDLDKAILEQIADEEKARDKYFDMAREADDAGMHQTARNLRSIGADEARHHMALQQMYQSPEFGPMREVPREELKLGEEMIEVPLGRPFPKAYGDWVNLAEDIKERYPDDPVMRASVSYQLGIIAREEEVEPVVEEAEVEEAKRWLARKAGDLGIT